MGYAIQRTDPGEFYHWHIDGGSHEFAMRQLVAIWYLNTLDHQGGETEFQYQEIRITPDWVIAAIRRDDRVWVPEADDVIRAGDTVLVIGRTGREKDLKMLFIGK